MLIFPGDLFITTCQCNVGINWRINTAAIDDGEMWAAGVIPAGEEFVVVELFGDQEEARAICILRREEELLDTLIPKSDQNSMLFGLWRQPTPYTVDIKLLDIEGKCKRVESEDGMGTDGWPGVSANDGQEKKDSSEPEGNGEE